MSQRADGQTGLDTQDEDGRSWAIREGHNIVYAAADYISGSISPFKRRDLGPWLRDQKLMALYEGVLFSKMDRATRRRDWDVRRWAEEHGKKLIVVSPYLVWPPKKGDTTTAIIWDDLINIAVAEYENTSERYLRMQKALRDGAFFVGKPPYAYRIVPVEGTKHKTLEPDPVRATIARRIFSLYNDDGMSLRQITDWLNDNNYEAPQPPKDKNGNVKPGAKWNDQGVRKILRSPAAIGRIQWNGKTYMRVDPIVTADEYRKAQETMSERTRNRGGGRNPSGTAHETALLTGIIVCPENHPMYRIIGRFTSAAPQGYYYCNKCPKGQRLMVPIHYADAAVNDAVMSVEDMPHLISDFSVGEDYSEDIAHVKRDMAELDPEADDYLTVIAEKKAELTRLLALQSERKPAKVERLPDGKTVGEVWQSLDTAGKRRWLLARRGSEWWPAETVAKVRAFPRDDNDKEHWPLVIDIGGYTDQVASLVTL